MADADTAESPSGGSESPRKGKGSFLDKNGQKIAALAAVAGVVLGYLVYRHSKNAQAAAANSQATTAGGGYAYPGTVSGGTGTDSSGTDNSSTLSQLSDQYAQLQTTITQGQQNTGAGIAALAAGQTQGFNDLSAQNVGLYAGQQVLGGQRPGQTVSGAQSSSSQNAQGQGVEGQVIGQAQQNAWNNYVASAGPSTTSPVSTPGSLPPSSFPIPASGPMSAV